MTHEEYQKLWIPAGKCFLHGLNDNQVQLFTMVSERIAKAVGREYPLPGHWQNIKMTPALRRKLRLLAGPHAETILKAHQIRKKIGLTGSKFEGYKE